MRTYFLRTYTLASREDLDYYKDVVWARHLETCKDFEMEPHGIWTSPQDEDPRLYVLESFPEGVDPAEVGQRFIQSPGFRSDLEGFDISKILGVDLLPLTPARTSPLQ